MCCCDAGGRVKVWLGLGLHFLLIGPWMRVIRSKLTSNSKFLFTIEELQLSQLNETENINLCWKFHI